MTHQYWPLVFRNKAHFRVVVKAKVELKSSILIFIGGIIEISPKGFTLGVKS
jgi:hypothetical protein